MDCGYNQWDNPADNGVGVDRHFVNKNNAYGMGIKVGENLKKGNFSLAYNYFYIEYAPTVPGFVDPDLLCMSDISGR